MRKIKDRKAMRRDGIPNEVWRGRGDGMGIEDLQ